MADASEISVALSTELNELVHAAVASGEYATGSEVIHEALREWKVHRTLRQHQQAELRLLWAEGLDSGAGRLGGMDEIKREARRRLNVAASPTD